MPHRFDNATLGKVTKTSQGYLRAPIRIGRADAILVYRFADGSTKRELRPREEVMRADSLNTAKSAPVSVGHKDMLNSDNTNKYAVGHLSDDIRIDGDYVETDVVITERKSINAVEKRELVDVSPGYVMRLDETPGELDGQQYDRIQRDIVYNHVALLPKGKGRNGSDVSIRLDNDDGILENESEVSMKVKVRFDGKEYEIEVANDTQAQILKDMSERFDSLNREKEKLEGEVSAVKMEAKEAVERADKAENLETINVIVQERIDAIDKLKCLNPIKDDKKSRERDLELQSKSVKEIRLDAIEAAGNKREDFEDKTDEFIDGFFGGLTVNAPKHLRASVGATVPKSRMDKKEEDKNDPIQAKADMNDNIQNAWRQKGDK